MLQAAPSGGKSLFLDELAARNEEDLNKLCRTHKDEPPESKGYNWEKIRSIMRNMQPVTITYNGESTLFRQTPWPTFLREFTNKFPDWPDLTVEIALNTIANHSGKG